MNWIPVAVGVLFTAGFVCIIAAAVMHNPKNEALKPEDSEPNNH